VWELYKIEFVTEFTILNSIKTKIPNTSNTIRTQKSSSITRSHHKIDNKKGSDLVKHKD
jgi:hypothetical protein